MTRTQNDSHSTRRAYKISDMCAIVDWIRISTPNELNGNSNGPIHRERCSLNFQIEKQIAFASGFSIVITMTFNIIGSGPSNDNS